MKRLDSLLITQVTVVISIMLILATPVVAIGEEKKAGVVLLHGNGHPTKHIKGLVRKLESHKLLVAYPEMPWSSNRLYDKSVKDAVNQVNAAFTELKKQGAQKLIIAGHSKGGVFALYYASTHPVDGLIAIAPGANVAAKKFKKKLGASVNKAKKMVKKGNGNKVATFKDIEGSRGVTDLKAPAASYYSWFEHEGAMNSTLSAKKINKDKPILWIVPTNDYKGLKKINTKLFNQFPSNKNTKFYKPSSNHKKAPIDSADEIIKWVSKVSL